MNRHVSDYVDYNLCSKYEVASCFIHSVTRSYELASSVRLQNSSYTQWPMKSADDDGDWESVHDTVCAYIAKRGLEMQVRHQLCL